MTTKVDPQEAKVRGALEQLSNEELFRLKGMWDFHFFIENIFSQSLDSYVSGWHIEDMCNRIQNNRFTATVGARFHAKSWVITQGYIAWRLFRLPWESRKMRVVSSKQDLAGENIREAIEAIYVLQNKGVYPPNEFMMESKGKTQIEFRHRQTGHSFRCQPLGVNSNMKSIHPQDVICDDLMGSEGDHTKRLSSADIERVKSIFDNDIQNIVSKTDDSTLHVVGNAVAPDDVIFMLEERSGWNWKSYPALRGAMRPYERGAKPMWPEFFTIEKLQEEYNKSTDAAWLKQMMCVPARQTENFLSENIIYPALIKSDYPNVDRDLKRYERKLDGPSYAFIDIGYSRHPSHITVLTPDSYGILWQRDISRVVGDPFLYQIPYHEQIEYCKRLIEAFNIREFGWDATGREFESFYQQKRLPRPMQKEDMRVTFNQYSKAERAETLKDMLYQSIEWDNPGTFERESSPSLRLQDHPEQTEQLLSVMGADYNYETPDMYMSHGDSFISLAGAAWIAQDKVGRQSGAVAPDVEPHAESGPFDDLFDEDFFEGIDISDLI